MYCSLQTFAGGASSASGISLASSSSHTVASFALSSCDEPGGYLWQASALEAFAKPERRLQVRVILQIRLALLPECPSPWSMQYASAHITGLAKDGTRDPIWRGCDASGGGTAVFSVAFRGFREHDIDDSADFVPSFARTICDPPSSGLLRSVWHPPPPLSVRRFLFLVSRHVNSTFGSKRGYKGGITTPNHGHGG